MKPILEYLYKHKTLTQEEAKDVLMEIASGKYNHNQIASFVTAFIMREITLDELMGFREALLDLCIKIDLSSYDPMDVCGTGGDGKNTFNISTLTSFVLAGAGVPIAKHGNYGVSSVSGSSNVLEYLGVKFQTDEDKIKQQIEEANICYLHAPFFHPALRQVASVRKELGVKTFFNMLGPLVNPARPKVQMTGVFNADLGRMYQYLMQKEDSKYTIVYSLDGYDEVTLTANTKILGNTGERIITPEQFGFSEIDSKALWGGDTVEEAAKIFVDIINGHGTSGQNSIVLANASLAFKTYFPDKDFSETLEMAKDSLFGLKAKQSFTILKEIQ